MNPKKCVGYPEVGGARPTDRRTVSCGDVIAKDGLGKRRSRAED